MRVSPAIAEREPQLRRLVIVIGVVILVGCFVQVLLKAQDGDFALHRETGRRFLAGEFIYTGGHDFPYPPFFALVWAPTALVPMLAAKIIFYPAAVTVLVLLVWILGRLVCAAFALNETQLFWVTGIALFLDVQYAIHDQAVFGLNTGITLLSWLGIYLWQQRRDVWGGLSLGAAIAIKCTPAIFLGYFIWKRQWRMAMCTTMAALLFTVLPIVRQGPALWTAHMQSWVRTVGAGLAGTGFEHNEDFQDKNMALRPVLLRYLTHLPDIGAADDPHAIRLLNLSPTAAHVLVGAVLLGLIALFLWCARGRLTSRDDSLVLWQCAALGVLMVLLSPITWGQHCVGLLPACFLISATLVVHERIPRWMMALLSVYVVCCCLAGRDLIGKRLGVLLVGYHITTFCIVGLLVIVLVASRQQESAK